MIGIETGLPAGYKGYIFHRSGTGGANSFNHHSSADGHKTELRLLGEFDRTTEWRKDQWQVTDDSFPKSLVSYLECSDILNAEEDD